MREKFNYKEYSNIISHIREHLPIVDFAEITNATEKFCVIRHDVEFSIDRALDLAILESRIGVKSSYMFQIRNNCYNAFSDLNLSKIKHINSLGHKIGLHAHMGALNNIEFIGDYIVRDIEIFSSLIGFELDRFSFHRPKKEHLICNLEIPNIINTYGPNYFHFTEDFKDLNVTYLADSQHLWNYGYPLDLDFKSIFKLQLNCHPYSWTEVGFANNENFLALLMEKDRELKISISNECKNFPF